MHNNLIDFIRKYCYIFLFILFETISMILLFRFNSYQGSVWFSAANSVAAGINSTYSNVMNFFNLEQINQELTAQNIALQRETEHLRQSLITATKDTTITEKLMREKLVGYNMVPATVVSNSAERSNNYLVIDRGEKDGIRPEMGVVGGGGVVGIIYLTGPHHSLVIPVTNRKSSISCRVRGQNYFGYLQWDGSSMLSAYVDDVPRYAKVKVGQAIETSGYSAVFPPGIFVGRVRTIRNSTDGQSYRLDVTLGTNFANLRDVLVVTTPYKAEIDTLQVHAQQADEASLNTMGS
ncbi:MAG: rod shape-determining protein MreC [Prevotellamassilia sp.]|jgi:rod shape-determining protein MreC|uniref:rod shape-determining protein MreC n=1 Tax=Alloprevotella sp. TaxID=1872471 RepID=UPI0015AF050C|nr:rod shape-determining protein MreC [Prevotellamassilia sp.]